MRTREGYHDAIGTGTRIGLILRRCKGRRQQDLFAIYLSILANQSVKKTGLNALAA
jgi:hypothetical protein